MTTSEPNARRYSRRCRQRRMARRRNAMVIMAILAVLATVFALGYYEQGAKDLSGAKLATLLKLCLALNCTLADILPDGETTELLTRYGQ